MTITRRVFAVGAAASVVGLIGIASTPAHARTLSFDERVAAQKAIEQVYWSQRIWPNENPGPKPPLSAVMSDEAIRAKVEDYLRKSNALERWWQRPVTGEQLQAELNRMAADTRDGKTLQALFDALGGDAFVIAETLARQTLVNRLIRNWYASDSRFHGALKKSAEAALASCSNLDCMRAMGGTYRESSCKLDTDDDAGTDTIDGLAKEFGTTRDALPIGRLSGLRETAEGFVVDSVLRQSKDEIVTASVVWPKRSFDAWWAAARGDVGSSIESTSNAFTTPAVPSTTCTNETWRPTRTDAADPRAYHTAIWTGAEMIVWGGRQEDVQNSFYNHTNTGARYNPATDSWTATSRGANLPGSRGSHTAVWTGTEMIVWGGDGGSGGQISPLSTGGRYNPSTDAWTATSTGANVPAPRYQHTAVWTGTEMIVWGGGGAGTTLGSGGRYNPSTNSWVAMSAPAIPPRRGHTAVWTGSRMVVWGGYDQPGPSFVFYNSGASYDPTSDQWTPTSLGTGVPAARAFHTAVWTGSEMIVWGGTSGSNLDSGGRYDPSADTWTATSTDGAPAPRSGHTAIWTGTEMIVWGGVGLANTAGRYKPSSNKWTLTSGANGLDSRTAHTAVWTGTEMIVWGGITGGSSPALNTGGRYNPSSDSWLVTSTGQTVPTARYDHTAVWTGAEMIVSGGTSTVNGLYTGGRYNASTDSWTPTSTVSYFVGRTGHSAVWTGTDMIVWGGFDVGELDSGARYNPTTDVWVLTSTGANVPAPRDNHTAVWTGSEMIVWGGASGSTALGTGGRYNPSTNTWSSTSPGAAKRQGHAAVWTGTEMIVWGGRDVGYLDTGGRYNPASDTWSATASGAPPARENPTAVWTGDEMIVWGGIVNGTVLSTGGRYRPSTNTWTSTSPLAGGARHGHTAVWTGTAMIVWGGNDNTSSFNTGASYNPASNSWMGLPGVGGPSARSEHTAVWTGTEMIVWGGIPTTSTGGRFCACPNGRFVYRDADGDGYGSDSGSMPSCDGSIPAGYTAVGGDCNDANPGIHPGAAETCNGLDDDCDAVVDNGGGTLCDDGNLCTDDACHGVSGCANVFNTAPCDDGDPCTSNDTCSAGTCVSGPPGRPAEIQGVALAGHGPTTLSWAGRPGGELSYDLATSTLEDLRANATTGATCLADDVPTASYVDTQTSPVPAAGYYYLVRGIDVCGTGSYGFDSAGAERIPAAACP